MSAEMAMSWEKQQLITDGFEPTYVDLEWYDGPRKGVALVDGVPHYHEGREYDRRDEADVYAVWPASEAAAALDREQRAVFVRYQVSDPGGDDRYRLDGVDHWFRRRPVG